MHFLAITSAAEIDWTIDDFERIRKRVPVIVDMKPSGTYLATDLHQAGGIPQVMKILLDGGLLHGDCMTITGKTIAEVLKDIPSVPRADQKVIRTLDNPLYKQGHLAILKGNISPEGCVAKITGLKNPSITGPARVFDSEDDAMAAIMAQKIKDGDIVVIRYEGPKGGPGMREMLAPTSALVGQGLGERKGKIRRRFSQRALAGVFSPVLWLSRTVAGHNDRARFPRSVRVSQRQDLQDECRHHDAQFQPVLLSFRGRPMDGRSRSHPRRGRRSPRRRRSLPGSGAGRRSMSIPGR